MYGCHVKESQRTTRLNAIIHSVLLVFNFECYCTVSGDDDLDHLFRSMEFFTEKTQL